MSISSLKVFSKKVTMNEVKFIPLFAGRYIISSDPKLAIGTLFLLTFPIIWVLVSDMPVLMAKTSFVFLLLVALFWLLAVFLFLLSACTDPGIIKKLEPMPQLPEEFHTEFLVETVNGVSVQRKWCSTCNLYRPLRAHHCRTCDCCIENLDHHCPWICNCVGVRNHRYFVGFIICTICLSILIGISVIWASAIQNSQGTFGGFLESMFRVPHRYPCLILSVITASLLIHLSLYQLSNISQNMTTSENLKKEYPDKNPFSNGWRYNCLSFWTRHVPPSIFDQSITNSLKMSVSPDEIGHKISNE